MKTQHTPSPWTISEHEHANVIFSDNGVICDVFHANEDDDMTASVESREESDANARLIAAAPELLSALERLSQKTRRANDIQHSGGKIEPEDWSELYALTNEAQAAIAKATK